MSTFDLTRAARADLKAIARYTRDRWGRRQRNAWLEEIDKAFHALAANPMMGRACEEVRVGYRKLPHGSHVIYYKQTSVGPLIVRILHATMDVSANIDG